jgi:hypothetical protein
VNYPIAKYGFVDSAIPTKKHEAVGKYLKHHETMMVRQKESPAVLIDDYL